MNNKSTSDDTHKDDVTIISSGLSNGLILGLFALLSVGLTSVTWIMTKEHIQTAKELALHNALSEIVSEDRFTNDPYSDCTLVVNPELLGTDKPQSVWRLRDEDGEPVAAVISSVAPNGYNGAIEIIVGHYVKNRFNNDSDYENLAGVRVTEHKETPGLGDKINPRKSDWILQFSNTNTHPMKQNEWQVKKDGGLFDGFTGATITPRAALAAIGKNIEYFNRHQESLFSAPSNCIITNNVNDEVNND